ncbi:hypothetical protein [Mesorhizobium sp.]|uniref:hypothetical protein n=1 Tax=Mesorhizobium sp. TaxID=1871066 RepID=UPI0025E15A93|nr:hypothetical protein [Mesorhizobium sp.]
MKIAGRAQPPRPPEQRFRAVFQQFHRDVPPSEKDTQDQHLFALDRESDADGAPITNNPQPGHGLDPLGAALWKRPPGNGRGSVTTKFHAIAGDARSAMSS